VTPQSRAAVVVNPTKLDAVALVVGGLAVGIVLRRPSRDPVLSVRRGYERAAS
jgi:hypothetical protein